MEGGLREQKKQRTRDAIVDAAYRLFDERGFEHTTIADIAAAADIAPRTFFGYFPSKEAVFFNTFEDDLAGLKARLQEREPGEDAIDALRAWIGALFADEGWDEKHEGKRNDLIQASPALEAYERGIMARFGDALRDAIAVDMGESPDSVRPRLAAAALIAAVDTLREVFGKDLTDEPLDVLDEALVFIRGGIEALQQKNPPR